MNTSIAPIQTVSVNLNPLYFGTPVALVTTRNSDGSANISAMSSAWALGNRVVLGMGLGGAGLENLVALPELVINFPSAEMWEQVERLAPTTGRAEVPAHKQAMGYRSVQSKFELAGFREAASELVVPPRIAECPLQIEARVVGITTPAVAAGDPDGFRIVETRVERMHAHPAIVIPGTQQIDTSRWRPLIYVFRHYFGTGERLGKTFRAET